MDPDAAGGFLHPGSNFQEDTVKLSRILGFWRRNQLALELIINNLGSGQGAE